jgi:hypothetical protein
VELHRLRPARDLTLADVIERSANYSQLRRQAAERQALPRPSAALGGFSAMALLAAATVPKLVGGGGNAHQPTAVLKEAADTAPVSSRTHAAAALGIPRPATHPPRLMRPTATHRAVARAATVQRSAPADAPAAQTTTSAPRATVASVTSHSSGGAGLTATPRHTVTKTGVPRPSSTDKSTAATHASGGVQVKSQTKVTATTPTHTSAPTPAPVSSGGYVNPLAHASLTPERIDQGVDYSGSGTLTALGAGRVVATSGSGWPGDFIEYRLTSGAYAGRYVFYAEHVAPVSGLRVGETVQPGQAIATISGGIEIGWGSGVGSQPLAQADGHWSRASDAANVATPEGRSFSALIASLGGPPGKVEG